MKKYTLIIATLFCCFISFAQNAQYLEAMKGHLMKLKNANTPEAFQAVANGFERIAGAEQKEWLPRYYAAFGYVMQALSIKENDKIDAIVDQADKLLAEAAALSNNDEVMCLQSLAASARIGVSPMERGMKYGPVAAELLSKAKAINPENPRIYYLQGTSAFYTPQAFGGGKDKAKTLFEKSLETYAKFKPVNELMPVWGADQCKQMLEQCK